MKHLLRSVDARSRVVLGLLLGALLFLAPWRWLPLGAAGAVTGILAYRLWPWASRQRSWGPFLTAAAVGGVVGAFLGGTEFGPFGPKVYTGPISRLISTVFAGLFTDGVLIGSGILVLRSALVSLRPGRSTGSTAPERWPRRRVTSVVLFLVGAASWGVLPGLRAADAFYVEDVRLVEPALYLAPLPDPPGFEDPEAQEAFERLPVRGHQMEAGIGTVVAYRWYSPGSLMTIDDESFEKLTIMIRTDLEEAGTVPLNDTARVVVAYSRGGSAWPAGACFGTSTDGTLRYRRWPFGRIRFDVSLEVKAVSGRTYCDGHIRRSLIVRPRSLASLSPWLGGCPAEHIC